MDGRPARARAWATLESICRKKRGSSCDSVGFVSLVELRRPVSQQAVVPARSRAAEVIRPIALLFLGLGGRGQGGGQRDVGDFFPGFASGFHGDLLVRILQFPESYGWVMVLLMFERMRENWYLSFLNFSHASASATGVSGDVPV